MLEAVATPRRPDPRRSPVLPPALVQHLASLDMYGEDVPLDELAECLRSLPLGYPELRDFARFDHQRYCRNCLRMGPAYEALLICWLPGQASPIHDHRGSACAFRVLAGQCVETTYERRGDEVVQPRSSRIYGPGSICTGKDLDIHKVGTAGLAELVTLHVYSPPLQKMTVYPEPATALQLAGPTALQLVS